jgi:hypothetical protein
MSFLKIIGNLFNSKLAPEEKLISELHQLHESYGKLIKHIKFSNTEVRKSAVLEIKLFLWCSAGRHIIKETFNNEHFLSIEEKFIEICKIDLKQNAFNNNIKLLFNERVSFYLSKQMYPDELSVMWFHKQNQPNEIIRTAFVLKNSEQAMLELVTITNILKMVTNYKNTMHKLAKKYQPIIK